MKQALQRMKLFPKTFLLMLSMFCVVILISHAFVAVLLPRLYLGRLRDRLHEHMEQLTVVMQSVDWTACDAVLDAYSFENSLNISAEYQGEVKLFQSSPIDAPPTIDTDEPFILEEKRNLNSFIIEIEDVAINSGDLVHLQLMVGTQAEKDAVWLSLTLLPFSACAALLFSILFSYFYSRRLIRPIRNMLTVTEGMKDLKQDAYFTVEGGDELAALMGQMNQVYTHLWNTIRSLEHEKQHSSELERVRIIFFRSASHELKTPLTGLRILLENMFLEAGENSNDAASLNTAIQTVDKLSDMVNELLAASQIQGEAGQAERLPLSVKTEIAQILLDYEVLARVRQLHITADIDETLQINMNPQFFRRVWSNLIDNAIRYTPPSGQIRIEGHPGILSIWNSCERLSDEQLEQIFVPFYRPEASAKVHPDGSGLGLYLVREILNANQLPFSFEPYEDGMRFLIRLSTE